VGAAYKGIEDFDIIDRPFETNNSTHEHAWEDPQVMIAVDEAFRSGNSVRILLSVNRKTNHQRESVLQANVPKGAAFFTYNGSNENVIKVNGVDPLVLSFLNENQEPEIGEDGTIMAQWRRNEVQPEQIFEVLESNGIEKIAVFAYDLAARGITFPGLTHQILVRSETTSINNLYQSLRICGYVSPQEGLGKTIFTTESVKYSLQTLVQFNQDIRALVEQCDGEDLVSEVLSERGLHYEKFLREIVSAIYGRIEQTTDQADPITVLLKTRKGRQR